MRSLIFLWCALAVAGVATTVPASRGQEREPAEEIRAARENFLTDVVFLTPDRGLAVGGRGAILATSNGGRTWQLQRNGDSDLLRITFGSAQEGWILGEEGLLLRTHDGGHTWQRQAPPRPEPFAAIRFVTPHVGWLVGDGIYATRDGGRTWHRQGPTGHVELRDIACLSPQKCVAAGGRGLVLTTADGGATWTQRVAQGYREDMDSQEKREDMIAYALRLSRTHRPDIDRVKISRDGTVWAIGGYWNSRFLLRSDDLGQSWRAVKQSLPGSSSDVFFLNSRAGVSVGLGIALTEDGGETWRNIERAGPGFTAVFFINERLAWVVGGFKTILHTKDGGWTWAIQHTELKGPNKP